MSRLKMTVDEMRKLLDVDRRREAPRPAGVFPAWFIVFLIFGLSSSAGGEEPREIASSRRWGEQFSEKSTASVLSEQIPPLETRYPLDAREVACIAAGRWKPAVGLRQRAITIQELHGSGPAKMRHASRVLACFLQLQAARQQDVGAASALRAYYSRIGVQEQQRWIEDGIESLEDQRAKQSQLLQRGTSAIIDTNTLDRSRLDLIEKSLEAQAQEKLLRTALKNLTGNDYDYAQRLPEPLIVQATELDCERLVEFAIRERMDLQAWRYLQLRINSETAPLAASLMATSIGGYGIPLSTHGGLKSLLSHLADTDSLVESLRCELATLILALEDSIGQTVREKCLQLQLAYDVHQIELQRVESWRNKLAQLERLESLGQTKTDEKLAALTGWRKAQSTEIVRRTEVKLAEIALSEAVGGLAARCCFGQAWLVSGRE